MNVRRRLGGLSEIKAAMAIMFLMAFIQTIVKNLGSHTASYPTHNGSLQYGTMQGIRPYHGTIDTSHQYEFPDAPASEPTSYIDLISYCLGALALFLVAKQIYRMWRNVPEQDLEIVINDLYDSSDSDEQDEALVFTIEDNEHEKRLSAIGFNGDIPEAFLDPVNRSIMFNPVILLTSDHTTTRSFDEMTVLQLMSRVEKPVCPLSRKPFNGYILNRDLKRLIEEWVEKTVRAAQTDRLNEMPRQRAEQLAQWSQQFFNHRKPCKHAEQIQNYDSLRKSM